MGWPYQKLVRPLLFAQDAERAHDFTLKILARASRNKLACDLIGNFFSAPELPVELFGLKFPNPIGLAAGMDKFAAAVPVWEKLGFGFCELGGVTWHPQEGNPAPRMFRAVADEAIVNRMGFKNPGAEMFAQRLAGWKNSGRWPKHPVGINLGKSKITPLEKAAEDYANSFRVLRDLADFFVVNVSSPNTPGLRQLQDKSALDEILAAMQERNGSQNSEARIQKPILVKVAPDLSFEALDEILELATQQSTVAKNLFRKWRLERQAVARTQHGNHPPHFQANQRQIANHRRRRNFYSGGCVEKNHGGRVACANLHQPCL